MAVPFGFSFGDFVAGLRLLKYAIEAIQETKGARAHYQALVVELDTLQGALIAIEGLRLSSIKPTVFAAVQGAVSGCQACLDDFLHRVAKYKPSLSIQWLSSGWKSKVRQIQWALFEKEDVASLRTQLQLHSSSINMLLLTCQMNEMYEQTQKQNASQQTLQAIHSATVSTRQGLHTKDLVDSSTVHQTQILHDLLQSNQKLVNDIQHLRESWRLQTEIPPQVELHKPVILLDACGMLAPFHLEFVTSEEAFIAVLKIRFRQAGVRPGGLEKLGRAEYVIRNRKGPISRTRPWEQIFEPGQEYDMRMAFRRNDPLTTCPSCLTQDEGNAEDDVHCKGCGRQYQRVTELQTTPHDRGSSTSFGVSSNQSTSRARSALYSQSPGGDYKAPVPEEVEEDLMVDFQRLQIITPKALSSAKPEDANLTPAPPRMLLSSTTAAKYLSIGVVMGSQPKEMASGTIINVDSFRNEHRWASSVLIISN